LDLVEGDAGLESLKPIKPEANKIASDTGHISQIDS
jgi:hypothetical protein